MISVEDLKRQARRHEASGRHDRAVECYERALERQRSEHEGEALDTSIYLSLADLHFRQGDVEAALDYYREAADHYDRTGLAQNALSVHKMSLRLFPERPEPYIHLADLYLRNGNEPKAREQVQKLAEEVDGSGEMTPGGVRRVARRYRADGQGERSNPGLIYLLEEAGCLPADQDLTEAERKAEAELAGETDAVGAPPARPEPAGAEEAGDEERSGAEADVAASEAAEAEEQPSAEEEPDEPEEAASGGISGGAGTAAAWEARMEGDAAGAEEPDFEPAAEAPDRDETEEESTIGGWDFLSALRPSRRSRPSRPSKSDREEEEPEYASSGPAAEHAEGAAEAEGGAPAGEAAGEEGPRRWRDEIEEAAEPEAGPEDGGGAGQEPEIVEPDDGEVPDADKPGLQSAAPVDEGTVRRSRRWNWPPSPEGQEEADEAPGESGRGESEEGRWTAEPSYEPAAEREPEDAEPVEPAARAESVEPEPEPAPEPEAAEPAERAERAAAWPPAPEGEEAGGGGARRPAAGLRNGLEIVQDMLELRPGSLDLLRRKAAYARRLGEESLLVESWLELAQTLHGRDGSRGARLLALRVLEMDPDSREAREMLRPVDQAVASTPDALEEELAGAMDSGSAGTERSLRRRVAREFADEVGALRWLEAATEVSLMAEGDLPDEFFHYFGRYLMAHGRWEDAGSMLERAAGDGDGPNAADHPELVFSLALIYRRTGRHDRAVECFRRLADVEESFAIAWRSLPESGAV